VLEENDDPSSMEDVLRELDKEKIEIVISKVIRRFNKPATIVRGLHDRKDVESITRDLKMKIGTGGTYKDKQIILQGDHRESVKTILLAKGFEEKSIEVL
jgi:translation initiation factor 1